MLPLAEAPRVYLDTAHLCELADGKRSPDFLDRCCRAMRTRGAVLVIGPAHMMDLHRRADAETRDRVFRFIDRFPRVATVRSSPPLRSDHQRLDALLGADRDSELSSALPDLPDLVLEDTGGNLKTALVAGGYDEADWVSTSLEGETLSIEGSGFLSGNEDELPRKAKRLLAKTFAMETRGEDGVAHLIAGSVRPELRRHPAVLAAEARLRTHQKEHFTLAILLGKLATIHGGSAERLARQAGPETDAIPLWWRAVPNGTARWLSAARLVAPGLYIKATLLRDKNRNSRRAPRPSDNADEFHVALVPYMDVMSLDRENFTIVNRYIGDVRTKRRATLVPNGDTASLVDAIEAVGRGLG